MPINISNLTNWGYYFNGNNKYPAVSISEPGDIKNIKNLEICTDVLIECLQNRVKVMHQVYNTDNKWTPALPPALPDNLNTILVPSGGKNGKWFADAQKAQLKSGNTRFKPWWATMLESGNYVVIFVVSEDEAENYRTSVDEKLGGNCYVVAYPGIGIGWGRFACSKIAESLKKNCWMVDDRVKSLNLIQDMWSRRDWKVDINKPDTPKNNKFINWKPICSANPFPNSAVGI